MLPLPEKALRREIVALHVKTLSQKAVAVDLELMLEIYLSELRAFPGDVVRDVLRAWSGKFFPARAELKRAITNDRRVSERKLRIDALKAFLSGEQLKEPKGLPPTEAQIRRNQQHF